MQDRRWPQLVSLALVLGLTALAGGRHLGATAPLRTLRLEEMPTGVVVDAPLGRADVTTSGPVSANYVVGSGGGHLVALDLATGTRLGIWALGPDPQALALDERRGRLLVATGDD